MLFEMSGPSGVGKTSLLESLSCSDGFLFGSDLSARVGVKEKELENDDLRKVLDSEFCDPLLVKKVFNMLLGSSYKNTQLLMECSLLQRALRLSYFSSLMKENHVLQDEGVVHAGYSLLLHSGDLEKAVHEYFSLIPTPECVVFLWAEPETVLGRIKERGSVVNVYRYLDEEEVLGLLCLSRKYFEIAADALRARNVDVSFLNVDGNLESSSKALSSLLYDKIDGAN